MGLLDLLDDCTDDLRLLRLTLLLLLVIGSLFSYLEASVALSWAWLESERVKGMGSVMMIALFEMLDV